MILPNGVKAGVLCGDAHLIVRLFMNKFFLTSSVGKKYVMAISGFFLFAFVIGHLIGNLQVFLGAEHLNAYGAFLHGAPKLLWSARIGLLFMVAAHITAAILLSKENKAARPRSYGEYRPVGSTYASRTMLMSGIIIAVFIVYHLLHFTAQTPSINLTGQDFAALRDEAGRHDVYRMMIIGFSSFWVSLFYIIGMGLLSLHLSHGVTSMFQSLGWRTGVYRKCLDRAALALAILIFAGYVSIPLAVLTGILK